MSMPDKLHEYILIECIDGQSDIVQSTIAKGREKGFVVSAMKLYGTWDYMVELRFDSSEQDYSEFRYLEKTLMNSQGVVSSMRMKVDHELYK